MNYSLRSVLKLLIVVLFFGVSRLFGEPTPAPVETSSDKAPEVLYVPGAYQDWKPATAPTLKPSALKPEIYEGYVNITGNGAQSFKFTNAPDWVHTNYGDGGNGTFSTDGKAAGLTAPEPGYYELTADLKANKWTATKTEWSIVGDDTPGGWDHDTKMTYDPAKQVWSATVAMKQAGAFKFRANGAWKIDFGVDDSNNLQYADNPAFVYNPKLKGLSVPADGTYTITLDLHDSGNYTFSVVKN